MQGCDPKGTKQYKPVVKRPQNDPRPHQASTQAVPYKLLTLDLDYAPEK